MCTCMYMCVHAEAFSAGTSPPPGAGSEFHCGAAAAKALARPSSQLNPKGQPHPWGAGGCGPLVLGCWFPPQKGFYAWKTNPHANPLVLNYSINNAAGAISSPKPAVAVTWLLRSAPASPPSSMDVGSHRALATEPGGPNGHSFPTVSPMMWPLGKPQIQDAHLHHPKGSS